MLSALVFLKLKPPNMLAGMRNLAAAGVGAAGGESIQWAQ